MAAIALTTLTVDRCIAQWKSYTMKREVRDLALGSDSTVWAATSGGLFSFHVADSTYEEFTTSEGLRSVDLSAIALDSHGSVWIGTTNGFLHRYDPHTRKWVYVTDIFLQDKPQKRINALQVRGDTLIILSDIGVSLFSISRMEFGDTYMRYGLGLPVLDGNVTDFEIFGGRMWVSTRSGIASTPTTNPNPALPESWQVYTTAQGLPSNYISELAINFDSLFAATRNGLAAFDGTTWYTETGTSGLDILGVTSGAYLATSCAPSCEMFLATPTNVWTYGDVGQHLSLFASGFTSPITALENVAFESESTPNRRNTERIMLGTSHEGAIVKCVTCESPDDTLIPPGPPSSKFIGIAVDDRGVVWSGTGAVNGEGFMSFDGSTWKQYTVASEPRFGTDNFYKVSIGANNAKWISNFGSGVALLDDRGNFLRMYDASNGIPPSIDPSFVVVGGVATDRNGAAWVTDRTPPGDTSIVIFKPDSTFSYVVGCGPGCATRDRQVAILSDVVIDEYGTKWFANFNRFEPFVPDRFTAFLYYNGDVALPGTSGGWGQLTTNDGLPGAQIWSVAVDRDGAVWVGTDQGVSIIYNPANPRGGFVAYRPPVTDQVIQGIVVDALNNKWLATKQGVFALPPDGTSVLERYTVENTGGKLLDDDIASIAIDPRSGTIYFGTEKGLTSLATSAVEPKRAFDELSFAPNPFHVPSSSDVKVDGLVAGSTLKILSIDGNLVREVRSPGGRVGFWDGRDEGGRLVSTGVYIVVAYSEDGSKISKGKLAVIRQ